jgi:cellulose synthase (UDP-forming)
MKKSRTKTVQSEASLLEKQLTSPTVTFILASATIGAIVYMIFLLQPSYRGDLLPYCLVIIAEIFLICHGIISFWTILSGRVNPRHFNYHFTQDRLFGESSKITSKYLETYPKDVSRTKQIYIQGKAVKVDVFVPVYGEDINEVKETAIAARDMYGKHMTYILDDGKSDELEAIAKDIGVKYIRRPKNDHAKAGNINYALRQTSGHFFVILDADFVADKYFLYETMPFFEDDLMSFVQTPQYYSNQTNFVSTAASFMQHVFYSLVQVGKNRFNAAFCVGTNVVFRRSAIEEIGGIHFESKSEDIWTSMYLHEHGYKSVYINKVLAIGKTPETIKAYSKQQLRWATGSFEIFLRRNPLANKNLTIDQRLQYFGTTAFYFNGFAVSMLLILPALQIFFNLTPIALDIPFYQWALLYSGFYVTQIILSMYTMGGFKFETLILSAASFPIYIKAFFNALRGKDEMWQATGSVNQYDSPFNYIRMQTYIFLFLFLTTIVGIWKSVYTHEFSVSIIWSLLNAYIFGYFIYVALRESRDVRKQMKAAKRSVENTALTTPKEA